MLKKTNFILLIIFIVLFSLPIYAEEYSYTEEEKNYIEKNKSNELTIGLVPYSGMDYFKNYNKEFGYIIDFVNLLEKEFGWDVKLITDRSWNDTYKGVINEEIDILFGANPTKERKEYLNFTEMIHDYPYAILSNKFSDIQTIGDLDKQNVGFIKGDVALDFLLEGYSSIDFKIKLYDNQTEALKDLNQDKEIKALVTSGGSIVYDYIYKYKNTKLLVTLEDLTSDMTFSSSKNNKILVDVLDKFIKNNEDKIKTMIKESEINYNYKILNLSQDDIEWIENNEIVVGAADDYLPFDYYQNGEYLGIAGEVFQKISEITGIKYKVVHGDFDTIYKKALKGEIDIVNMAKTSEREVLFDFPVPFSKERDYIYGLQSNENLNSIYDLEGKTVAIIDGFWHEEYLNKNLRNYEIYKTKTIHETLEAIDNKKADYFIENPTVAEYYIRGLDYNNIIQKGTTSEKSYLYFGVNKEKKIITKLLNRSIPLINYKELKSEGLRTAPALESVKEKKLRKIIMLLIVFIVIIIFISTRLISALINKKAETRLLKEKEMLMYTDGLTGLYNRMYFNNLENRINDMDYPQGFIMADLNNLKIINDTYGHLVGDESLSKYADLLKYICPNYFIFRMGGDEFLLFKPGVTENEIIKKIKELKKEVETVIIYTGEKKIQLSAALGYSIRDLEDQSINQKIMSADEEMYINKRLMKQ